MLTQDLTPLAIGCKPKAQAAQSRCRAEIATPQRKPFVFLKHDYLSACDKYLRRKQ